MKSVKKSQTTASRPEFWKSERLCSVRGNRHSQSPSTPVFGSFLPRSEKVASLEVKNTPRLALSGSKVIRILATSLSSLQKERWLTERRHCSRGLDRFIQNGTAGLTRRRQLKDLSRSRSRLWGWNCPVLAKSGGLQRFKSRPIKRLKVRQCVPQIPSPSSMHAPALACLPQYKKYFIVLRIFNI